MKKSIFLCIYITFFFSILHLLPVEASSAAGVIPASIDIPFFPNYEEIIDFRVIGYTAIDFEMKCPYVHVNNETLTDEDGVSSFTVTLKLPEKIEAEPGDYNCGFIMHRPQNPNMPPGIGAFAEVGARIMIKIPVKGKYAAMELSAQNANKGEPVYFKLNVRNLGDTDIKGVIAVIDIQDIENKTIEKLYTDAFDVLRYQSAEVWKRMETANYEPAKYRAKAALSYGGPKDAYAEAEFLIGKLFVNVLGMESNATAGKINPVSVNVESWWGNPIENVHAVVSMKNESGVPAGEFNTISVDLSPWQKASVGGYWDTDELMPGLYDADVTLVYKGGETKASYKIPLYAEEQIKTPLISFDKFKDVIASPVFVVLLVLILVINISVWMLKQRKQKKKAKKEKR